MSLWIKRDVLLPRNRKTYRLAELLAQGSGDLFGGRDEVAWQAIAVVTLEQLWCHVLEHYPKGDLTDATVLELRDALSPWLLGTEWSKRDPRDLLIQSGHLLRSPRGRITVRDWREWTGSDAERLATDRKRKRLSRSRYPKNWESISRGIRSLRPTCECDGRCGESHPNGTCGLKRGRKLPSGAKVIIEVAHLDHDPSNCSASNLLVMCHGCHSRYDASAGGPRDVRRTRGGHGALAERSRAERREEEKQPAAATPALDYATRCVIAVNLALDAKLGAFKSLVATVEQDVARAWEALGVPIELAEQVLADVTRRFRSTTLNRQPSTLRYFDAAIREAFEADRAHGAGRPEVPYDEAVRVFREAGLETYHVPGPGFRTRQALERALASARRSAVA